MKLKHAREIKRQKISPQDEKQMRAIYNVRPHYANGVYLTPVLFEQSTLVRMAFAEFNYTLRENVPVTSIIMSIEDLQTNYNAMTELLQQMRTMGRIK